MTLGGIVLAGGRSRRMGVDKALLDWHGTPLVVHVAGIVRSTVEGPVVVVAALGQELPALPDGVERVDDVHPERGPLEGLHGGLVALGGRADVAVVVGVDAALLRPRLVDLLVDALEREDAALAVACVAADRRPLPMVVRVDLEPAVRSLLESGERRLRSLVALGPVAALPEAEVRVVDPELDSLAPLNTPDELAAALVRASG